MDVWGAIFRDQWNGIAARHEIERDDGRVEVLESAANYFQAPRNAAEQTLMERLQGPVLDLAAGAGSYTLYLQSTGVRVTAADFSAGARDVCRARGCHDVVAMDLRDVRIESAAFRSIIIMGNTLGAHQTPNTLPGFLRSLRRGVTKGGHLLFTMIDPLDTTDESHLQYQEANRNQGRPPGLIKMRVKYNGQVDEWIDLWMLTDEELTPLASDAGWALVEQRSNGPWRIRLYEAR